jgi:hypothetical protein
VRFANPLMLVLLIVLVIASTELEHDYEQDRE